MIEVLIPGTRHGRAVVSAAVQKGRFCYMNANTAAGVNIGDDFQLSPITALTANAIPPTWVAPVNKLIFREDQADTEYETIAALSRVLYYQDGDFETDVCTHPYFSDDTWPNGVPFGTRLTLTDTGQLTPYGSASAATSCESYIIAMALRYTLTTPYRAADGSTPASATAATAEGGYLQYRLLNWRNSEKD